MGIVYRAVQSARALEHPVAIKVLRALALGDDTRQKRFENEIRIIASLKHPNTLKLLDAGTLDDGRPFVVTELLEGRTLAELLEVEKRLEPARALRIALQVAGALNEAHTAGVVHRDLKPANIFVQTIAGQEIAKVLDFGLARDENLPTLTQPNQTFGTPAYMSPEQCQGLRVGPRSDLYSFGAILLECLAGEPLFSTTDPSPLALMWLQVGEVPVSLSERPLARDVPPALSDLVMLMLEKEADERPETVSVVIDRMNEVLQLIQAQARSTSNGSRKVPPIVAPFEPMADSPALELDAAMGRLFELEGGDLELGGVGEDVLAAIARGADGAWDGPTEDAEGAWASSGPNPDSLGLIVVDPALAALSARREESPVAAAQAKKSVEESRATANDAGRSAGLDEDSTLAVDEERTTAETTQAELSDQFAAAFVTPGADDLLEAPPTTDRAPVVSKASRDDETQIEFGFDDTVPSTDFAETTERTQPSVEGTGPGVADDEVTATQSEVAPTPTPSKRRFDPRAIDVGPSLLVPMSPIPPASQSTPPERSKVHRAAEWLVVALLVVLLILALVMASRILSS